MESKQKRLHQFPAGSLVRIENLCECPKARSRLCALGLTPGTTVEICSGGPGPCLLKVRGCSVAIGHGMADRVLASSVNGNGKNPSTSSDANPGGACLRCPEKAACDGPGQLAPTSSTTLEDHSKN